MFWLSWIQSWTCTFKKCPYFLIMSPILSCSSLPKKNNLNASEYIKDHIFELQRKMHHYRRDHGFQSHSDLKIFFSGFNFTITVYNCNDQLRLYNNPNAINFELHLVNMTFHKEPVWWLFVGMLNSITKIHGSLLKVVSRTSGCYLHTCYTNHIDLVLLFALLTSRISTLYNHCFALEGPNPWW